MIVCCCNAWYYGDECFINVNEQFKYSLDTRHSPGWSMLMKSDETLVLEPYTFCVWLGDNSCLLWLPWEDGDRNDKQRCPWKDVLWILESV